MWRRLSMKAGKRWISPLWLVWVQGSSMIGSGVTKLKRATRTSNFRWGTGTFPKLETRSTSPWKWRTCLSAHKRGWSKTSPGSWNRMMFLFLRLNRMQLMLHIQIHFSTMRPGFWSLTVWEDPSSFNTWRLTSLSTRLWETESSTTQKPESEKPVQNGEISQASPLTTNLQTKRPSSMCSTQIINRTRSWSIAKKFSSFKSTVHKV